MKKLRTVLGLVLLTITCSYAQNKNQMEKNVINPGEWQNQRSYLQAVEVKQAESTLCISEQTAINAVGESFITTYHEVFDKEII